jgi:Uma2 family endonuclease
MDLVTWEEFVELPDDDRRELIDGHLVEVEVPDENHELIVAALCHLLRAWARRRKAGRVLASGYKVRIAKYRGVMPDVQFFRTDNPTDRIENAIAMHRGRPDLAIEIISPSSVRYDRVKKLNWYKSIGVPEYWLISPKNRLLERFVLKDEHYVLTHSLEEGDVLRPSTMKGLRIPVSELFVDLTSA